jgi:hypothetical protein
MLVAFLSIWHWKTAGHLSLSAIATFATFSWIALVYGDFFLRISPLSSKLAGAFTFRFLFGYFTVNTFLVVLSLASQVSVASGFLIIAAGAIIILFVRRGESKPDFKSAAFVPDLLCVLVSATAATLWCADALNPTLIHGPDTIFRVSPDSFVHTRIISMFSQAHGIGSLSDMRMSGAPLSFYHYSSYFLPAAVVSLTGASAFDVFVGFQLPFGIMLTGLAAFAFAASLWGFWPGLAASCALLLLPDAYQQGFGSRFLSYNWLQQVALGGLYGVSCVAAAWIFILDGCRSGKYRPIIYGYAFILLTLIYKSQIFVANAFLGMMYPCVFLSGLPASRRWLAAISFLAIFVLVVWLSQQSEAVPLLRLDFSSTSAYAGHLFWSYDPGFLRDFYASHIISGQPRIISLSGLSKIIAGLFFAGMILLSSFGLWVLASAVMFLRHRTTFEPAVLFFPILVIVNYLVMSLGLAMDTRGIGQPEELLNRPLVWAYFGVVAWTAGAAYAFAFGDSPPKSVRARGFIALLTLSSLIVPWLFARNLQTFPAAGFNNFTEFNRFPTCLVRASHYLREHSRSGDVIQDSVNDRNLLVGALAERQGFAVDWGGWSHSGDVIQDSANDQNLLVGTLAKRQDLVVDGGVGKKGLRERLKERLVDLAVFKTMTSETDLMAFAVKNKIAWYLLRPSTKVSWPVGFLENFAFDCEGYRVYRFPTSPR